MPQKPKKSNKSVKSGVHVQNFGLFWSTEYVDWNGKKLLGIRRIHQYKARKTPNADSLPNFWGQKGIYVLYKNYSPIYVGQIGIKSNTDKKPKEALKDPTARVLGDRLKEHHIDDLANKWDKFSWFGFCKVGKTKELGKTIGRGSSGISFTSEVHLLEALLISMFGGSVQNKQDGGWKKIGVERYDQYQDADILKQNDNMFKFTEEKLDKHIHEIASLKDKVEGVEKLVQSSIELFKKTFPYGYEKGTRPRIEREMKKKFDSLEKNILSIEKKVGKLAKVK
ncbi:MAG: hypothetical protein WCH46_00470 [bacterium]